jgi:hypothetical protein
MVVPLTKHVYLAAILAMLAGIGSSPLLAQAPEGVILETGKPVIPDLIRRILEDPHRGYANVAGSFDCASEAVYLRTREILGQYATGPEENQAALSGYILSGKEQCNCAQAIVGKEFDILLHDLGPETDKFRSCGGMYSVPSAGN